MEQGVWGRAVAADPFWAPAEGGQLPGVVMPPTRLRQQPGSLVQFLERPFTLTASQAKLLRSDKYELQCACVLMDDPVAARLHWPFLAHLRVNGTAASKVPFPPQLHSSADLSVKSPAVISQRCLNETTVPVRVVRVLH